MDDLLLRSEARQPMNQWKHGIDERGLAVDFWSGPQTLQHEFF
jgi:hypothetical protein